MVPLLFLELLMDKLRYNRQVQGFQTQKPGVTVYLRVNLQQIKFDNESRAENTTRKVRVSYLHVRNQVANSRIKFVGLNVKNMKTAKKKL